MAYTGDIIIAVEEAIVFNSKVTCGPKKTHNQLNAFKQICQLKFWVQDILTENCLAAWPIAGDQVKKQAHFTIMKVKIYTIRLDKLYINKL